MRKNKLKLGLGVLTVLTIPIVVNTVASSDVLATQGWVKSGNTWSFYNNNGTLARNTWAGNYWLGADGKMVTNAWVDNGRYYVGSNGAWVKDAKKPEAKKQGWVKNGSAWNYYYQGNIVKNAWIGSYWLGADGKMATNAWVDNGRYYVGSNGVWVKDAKKSGWEKEGTAWYYLDEKGAPVKNKWIGNYWLGADGKMSVNTWVDNGRYYVDGNGAWVKGAKKSGWEKEGTAWYYLDEKGTPVKNKWIGNYWLGADGKMSVNTWVDNGRYYVDGNGAWVKGAKKSGWKKEGKDWYYLNDEGTPVKNKWIGNYWLGADGKMATNAWVDNKYYYVDENGLWDKNKKRIDPVPTGHHTGWVRSGSTWYYFSSEGKLVKNKWIGNYWLADDGHMETNAWVDNSRYYVGSNGEWVKNPSENANINKVLDIARSYLGVETGSAGHKKIVDAYNSVNPKPVGYTANYDDDWCDIFVTTVFQQAGLSNLIGRECGVQRHIGIMERKGIWKGKSYPKQGDIVTFDWDGGGFADHIGIVESVNNGVITTIEGNSSLYAGSTAKTRVNRKTYNWDSRYIKGYGRPSY